MPGMKVGGPIVARLFFACDHLVQGAVEEPEKARLTRYQFHSPYYGKPIYAPVIKTNARSGDIVVVEVYSEPRKWLSLKKGILCNSCQRTVVKAYRVARETVPKKDYVVVWGCWEGASTRKGAFRDVVSIVHPERPKPLLFFTSSYSSKSGNHWLTALAYVGPGPLKVSYRRTSNLGNTREIEYVFSVNGYEERVVRDDTRDEDPVKRAVKKALRMAMTLPPEIRDQVVADILTKHGDKLRGDN